MDMSILKKNFFNMDEQDNMEGKKAAPPDGSSLLEWDIFRCYLQGRLMRPASARRRRFHGERRSSPSNIPANGKHNPDPGVF